MKDDDGFLNTDDILNILGDYGLNMLLIEGGKELISSFLSKNLVDEVYLYTSNNNLDNASLNSPFILDEDWEVLKKESFENDSLLIARRKELCLQEL